MSTYMPDDDDIGSYLRVPRRATPTRRVSGKSAMAKSDYKPCRRVRGANKAPVFPDQNPDMPEDQSLTATREVAENTVAGQAIGDPLVAEDEHGDILTYTLLTGD